MQSKYFSAKEKLSDRERFSIILNDLSNKNLGTFFQSEEYVLKRRRLTDDNGSDLLLIPEPPEFSDLFSNIVHLLDCDTFITLMVACLSRSFNAKAQLVSEGILNRVKNFPFLG